MSVEIKFDKQENGGFWFTITSPNDVMIGPPVTSWRRGKKEDILKYHADNIIKRCKEKPGASAHIVSRKKRKA